MTEHDFRGLAPREHHSEPDEDDDAFIKAVASEASDSPVAILRKEQRQCARDDAHAAGLCLSCDEQDPGFDRAAWLAEQIALTRQMNHLYANNDDDDGDGDGDGDNEERDKPRNGLGGEPGQPAAADAARGAARRTAETSTTVDSLPPLWDDPTECAVFDNALLDAWKGLSTSTLLETAFPSTAADRLTAPSLPPLTLSLAALHAPTAPSAPAPSVRGLAGQCRFCLAEEDDESLLVWPCTCKAPVHRTCLVKWRRAQPFHFEEPLDPEATPRLQTPRCEVCRTPWTTPLAPAQEELWFRRVMTNPNYRPLPDGMLDDATQLRMLRRMAVGQLIIQNPFRAATTGRLINAAVHAMAGDARALALFEADAQIEAGVERAQALQQAPPLPPPSVYQRERSLWHLGCFLILHVSPGTGTEGSDAITAINITRRLIDPTGRARLAPGTAPSLSDGLPVDLQLEMQTAHEERRDLLSIAKRDFRDLLESVEDTPRDDDLESRDESRDELEEMPPGFVAAAELRTALAEVRDAYEDESVGGGSVGGRSERRTPRKIVVDVPVLEGGPCNEDEPIVLLRLQPGAVVPEDLDHLRIDLPAPLDPLPAALSGGLGEDIADEGHESIRDDEEGELPIDNEEAMYAERQRAIERYMNSLRAEAVGVADDDDDSGWGFCREDDGSDISDGDIDEKLQVTGVRVINGGGGSGGAGAGAGAGAGGGNGGSGGSGVGEETLTIYVTHPAAAVHLARAGLVQAAAVIQGVAVWSSEQLLAETARGGWGLCHALPIDVPLPAAPTARAPVTAGERLAQVDSAAALGAGVATWSSCWRERRPLAVQEATSPIVFRENAFWMKWL